jgi:ADP-heptose:LPS heptosyltransferase
LPPDFFIARPAFSRYPIGPMPSPQLQTFAERTRAATKVIVVDLGFLGDTVHLVPALWEIKRQYPRAALHVLASPLGGEVLKLVPCVDRVWAMPLGPPSPKWWEHWDLLRALRRERFDVAFNFSGADRTMLVTRFIGAPHALGYQGARKHCWQPWLVSDWIPRRSLPAPVYAGRRELLRLAGFTLQPVRFELAIPPDARQWAEANVPAGAVHFSLSASSPLKEWPLRHWIELAGLWVRGGAGRAVIASGSPSPREQERLRHFAAGVGDPRVHALPAGISLAQLAAALSRCEVHVGADSGVLHLATALGTRTLAIFREYAGAADWLPPGPGHRHLSQFCPCANAKQPPCAAANEARCLAEVPPARVAELLAELSAST